MKIHLNSLKQKGKLNSQYGKVWYYNPITLESKSFKKDDQIPIGWLKGRKCLQPKAIEKSKQIQLEYEKNPKLCEYCNKPISYKRRFLKSCCNEHGKLLNRIHNHETQSVKHTTGGKRHGAGRGKKGWYKGYYCDSSWELAIVIYWLEHNIQFKRNNGYFEYQFDGKIRKYYPDFLMSDGSFVEVKGYSSKQWQAKLKAFPKDKTLLIYGKNEIMPIIQYVVDKYGKDYIKLYD